MGIAAIGGTTWYFLASASESVADKPILAEVKFEPFDHVVIEPGEIESSNSVEVKCAVKSRNQGGTEIVWVTPEGTWVQEGDVICRLDSSMLEQERDQQKIMCNTSQALVVQADNALKAAEIALKEYQEGTYTQERQLILNEIFVANESLERTRQAIAANERLQGKGLLDSLQAQADAYAIAKAMNDLDLARTKLRVIDEFTSQKMITTLESDIATAAARLESDKESHALELKKLAELEAQVAVCVVKAPKAGQIVHANTYSSRGGNAEFVVEQGARVTEGKTIFRIPDPSAMQVKAKINESRITKVREGLPAIVKIDALPDSKLQARVTRVDKYALPGGFGSSPVKQYATYVEILDPPPTIRSGMTAEVNIYVERRPQALQAPVQAVLEHQGKIFALVQTGEDKFETREIKIGSSNDKVVTIESDNLKQGDKLVLNPRSRKELLDLPEIEGHDQVQLAVTAPTESPTPSTGPGATGPGGSEGASRGGGRGGPGVFERFDGDGDGRISAEEMAGMPDQLKERMASADANGDGVIDRDEVSRVFSGRRGGGGPPGGDVPGGEFPGTGPVGGGE
jgi:multidrug efflux pump subunit AcrA (membrane-fusion protein)